MGLFNLFKPAQTVLVVDVVALNDSVGLKGNVAPRNQLQSLRRLARFAQREKLEVIAVASGSPLNKAPAGKKFEGIVVLYSQNAEEHGRFLAKTVRSKGSGAILVSGTAEAEKQLGSGALKMRISTFRKAFESGGDPEPTERSSGNGNRGNRNPRNRSRQKPAVAQTENKPPRPQKEMSQADAINELIDLVD
ncbi:MAG: hypothetical protein JXR25_09185 [Pontiellaceae bacterium]|nr:hypothetical protein [Pontiellaceae bacterium]MBN2784990.1 hypothetical protein [Pontiellaceae bacterium]